SIGHSNATYDEAIKGIDAGATHMTHLFNAMTGLHHRDPGVVGAGLFQQEVKVEMIADRIHVRKELINLAYRIKGREGFILVSDAMRAKCMGDGHYELGGQEVIVSGG
ncbi:MAG TPA: N-acetylglucosamine-6-phosphate deacetylase, partial [Paenibacillaceae bacterium]|nr:N-acetylglucosamine-6-phosphate deacetylase [Paenibacillaceae bacterium]